MNRRDAILLTAAGLVAPIFPRAKASPITFPAPTADWGCMAIIPPLADDSVDHRWVWRRGESGFGKIHAVTMRQHFKTIVAGDWFTNAESLDDESDWYRVYSVGDTLMAAPHGRMAMQELFRADDRFRRDGYALCMAPMIDLPLQSGNVWRWRRYEAPHPGNQRANLFQYREWDVRPGDWYSYDLQHWARETKPPHLTRPDRHVGSYQDLFYADNRARSPCPEFDPHSIEVSLS